MSLPPLRGHAEARVALGRAVQRNELAQSLLLHGPAGIGKERLALWLAQRLVCEASQDIEPCGGCDACRRAARLEHPDVHWFFPLPRPEAGSPARLREKLEEQRAAELQLRRENPAYVPTPDRPPALFLAAIQSLQELAVLRPSMGRRKVFVVGDAETMVPQESSPEAANAFLKLLEEPPADTTLILTSSAPEALLPTIRSRVVPFRLLPLATGEVEQFLLEHAGADAATAREAGLLSGGSIGRALRGLSPGTHGPREVATALLRAVLAQDPLGRLAAAHAEAPAGGRGAFLQGLDAFAERLRDLLAAFSGAADQIADPTIVPLLDAVRGGRSVSPEGVIAAVGHVLRARDLALGNVNPQLILADLLQKVQAELRPARARR